MKKRLWVIAGLMRCAPSMMPSNNTAHNNMVGIFFLLGNIIMPTIIPSNICHRMLPNGLLSRNDNISIGNVWHQYLKL